MILLRYVPSAAAVSYIRLRSFFDQSAKDGKGKTCFLTPGQVHESKSRMRSNDVLRMAALRDVFDFYTAKTEFQAVEKATMHQ